MFRRRDEDGAVVTIHLDGRPIAARRSDSVAAALIAAGAGAIRTTPAKESPRAPFCMMGICFDCLATVDGIEGVQTCLAPVREGMRIERASGRKRLRP